MAEKEKDLCRVTLVDVRLSYPQLWKARKYAETDAKGAFSAAFLIDKDSKLGQKNMDKVEDAIEEAKFREWKDKIPKIKASNIAYSDGDDRDGEENEGMMIVAARNYSRPKVLDRDKTDLVEEDGVIYGGCYVDAVVRFWAQDFNGTKRINCSLEAVRYRRKGEAFGAAPFDPDEFDDLDDEDEDDAPRSRSRKPARDDDDDEDEAPRSRRKSSRDDDDDEDEKPRSRKPARDDEDEDDVPRSRRKSSRDDEDDEDEKPRRKTARDDVDDEDEKPRRKTARDDVDDEDRPSRNSRSRKPSRDEDDDEDEKPRSRRRGRDDDDAI